EVAVDTMRPAVASCETSATSDSTTADGTASRMVLTTPSSSGASRSTSRTLAPSSQNSCPVAEPMPPAPPVTIATLSLSRPATLHLLFRPADSAEFAPLVGEGQFAARCTPKPHGAVDCHYQARRGQIGRAHV